jgi:NAD(P)-dependent dehydrogenase (short-subunit alcohol dehydrogenase family)
MSTHSGKVALVTGSGCGIAERLAAEGALGAINHVRDADARRHGKSLEKFWCPRDPRARSI